MINSLLILLILVVQSPQAQPNKSAKEYFYNGVAKVVKKDLDGAINDLTRAIELDPQYVDAVFLRAQCHYQKLHLDEALLDYDKVIELEPQRRGIDRVHNDRGGIRFSKGDFEGAVRDFDEAIALDPNFADAYANRGLVRAFRKDTTGAASDYDKALTLNPNLRATYIDRGVLRYQTGNLAGAITDFNRAVEIVPTAHPYVDLTVLHTLRGEIGFAVASAKRTLSLDQASFSEKVPAWADSPFKRLGRFIAANPTNARAFEARGLLRLGQGRRTEAAQDFAKTIELDPKLRSETQKLMNLTF